MAEMSVTVVENGAGPYGQDVTIGSHRLLADEPVAVGGRDTGPGPYELLMAALGACTSMTIRMYAQRQNWPLEKVSVTLRHTKVPTGEGGALVDRFERDITLTGDLDAAQRQRCLAISDRCPVSRTLGASSQVTAQLVTG